MTWTHPSLEEHFDLTAEVRRDARGVIRAGSDRRTGATVSIRIPGGPVDLETWTRVQREVASIEDLHHPNVADFVGLFRTAEGLPALVHEAVAGTSLEALLEAGPRSVEEALAWGGHVAAALDALHARGLLHRSLAPSRLTLGEDGVVRLADHGALGTPGDGYQLARTGEVPTGLASLPPEVLRGSARLTPAADVYSLGCLLYQLVEGRPPFEGPPDQVLRGHQAGTPPPVRVPPVRVRPAVNAFFAAVLAKDPAARPPGAIATMEALAVALRPPARAEAPPPRLLVGALLAGVLLGASTAPTPRKPDPGSAPASTQEPGRLRAMLPFGANLAARVEEELATVDLGDPDPVVWAPTTAGLPHVERFFRWMEDGGRPEVLGEEPRRWIAEAEEVYADAGLESPFFPFFEVAPLPRSLPPSDPVLGVLGWHCPELPAPRALRGWEGRALELAAEASGALYEMSRSLAETPPDRWFGGLDVPEARALFAIAAFDSEQLVTFASRSLEGRQAVARWLAPFERQVRKAYYAASRAAAEGRAAAAIAPLVVGPLDHGRVVFSGHLAEAPPSRLLGRAPRASGERFLAAVLRDGQFRNQHVVRTARPPDPASVLAAWRAAALLDDDAGPEARALAGRAHVAGLEMARLQRDCEALRAASRAFLDARPRLPPGAIVQAGIQVLEALVSRRSCLGLDLGEVRSLAREVREAFPVAGLEPFFRPPATAALADAAAILGEAP